MDTTIPIANAVHSGKLPLCLFLTLEFTDSPQLFLVQIVNPDCREPCPLNRCFQNMRDSEKVEPSSLAIILSLTSLPFLHSIFLPVAQLRSCLSRYPFHAIPFAQEPITSRSFSNSISYPPQAFTLSPWLRILRIFFSAPLPPQTLSTLTHSFRYPLHSGSAHFLLRPTPPSNS